MIPLSGNTDDFTVQDLQIKGKNVNCFRPGEWANITGVRLGTPINQEPRLVYVCEYCDGLTDYVPVSDSNQYIIEPRSC